MKPFEFHDEARAELDAAAGYYDAQAPGTGKRFLLAADTAIQRLLYDPSARPVAVGNVRRQPVEDFPYDILFVDEPHRVWIVAAVHYSRRTAYWRNRL